MKSKLHALLALALSCAPSLQVLGQTPAAAQPQDERLRISSTEVALDVVAKDKRGRAVTDLAAEDFEVYEDGVRQPVESFRLVTRGAARPAQAEEKATAEQPAAAASATPVEKRTDPEIGVSVVALVFDRLSPDARKRAHDAALSYVGENASLSSFVGVYAINLSLVPLQTYTTDINLVRQAVARAGSLASAGFEQARTPAGASEAAAQRDAALSAAVGAAAAGGAGAAAAGAASVDQKFAEMQQRAQETFEVLQRDQQGYATTNGLTALVNSMRALPGRKAVIFFSEGLALPPNVKQHFRSVINAANRTNVSVYAVDAAGLRAESPNQGTRDEINARSRRRMDTLDRAMVHDGPLTAGLERNEDLLTLNPQSGLMQLAHETGGQFIGDTNKIGPKLKEIDEELSTYYLMTYAPTNQSYDGKFRNISVKVRRGGVDVQARKGYYAVTPTGSTPLFYYEAMPLAALKLAAPDKQGRIQYASALPLESLSPGRYELKITVSDARGAVSRSAPFTLEP